MKNTLIISEKFEEIENKFKCLTSIEMINLRGGGDPPLPPGSGDDFPIKL